MLRNLPQVTQGISAHPGFYPRRSVSRTRLVPTPNLKDQSVKLNKLQNSGFSVITAPLIFTGGKAFNHKLIHTYILHIQFF